MIDRSIIITNPPPGRLRTQDAAKLQTGAWRFQLEIFVWLVSSSSSEDRGYSRYPTIGFYGGELEAPIDRSIDVVLQAILTSWPVNIRESDAVVYRV